MHQLQNFELVAEADDANMENFDPIIDINSRLGGGEHNPSQWRQPYYKLQKTQTPGRLHTVALNPSKPLQKLSQTFPRAQSTL